MSKWLHYNSFVVSKVVNLVVFVFIVTAFVYVDQHGKNEEIENYLDALYFTLEHADDDGASATSRCRARSAGGSPSS